MAVIPLHVNMVREIAQGMFTLHSNAGRFPLRVRSCRLRGTRLVLQRDVFSSRRGGFVQPMVRHDKARDGKSCAQKVGCAMHAQLWLCRQWCS